MAKGGTPTAPAAATTTPAATAPAAAAPHVVVAVAAPAPAAPAAVAAPHVAAPAAAPAAPAAPPRKPNSGDVLHAVQDLAAAITAGFAGMPAAIAAAMPAPAAVAPAALAPVALPPAAVAAAPASSMSLWAKVKLVGMTLLGAGFVGLVLYAFVTPIHDAIDLAFGRTHAVLEQGQPPAGQVGKPAAALAAAAAATSPLPVAAAAGVTIQVNSGWTKEQLEALLNGLDPTFSGLVNSINGVWDYIQAHPSMTPDEVKKFVLDHQKNLPALQTPLADQNKVGRLGDTPPVEEPAASTLERQRLPATRANLKTGRDFIAIDPENNFIKIGCDENCIRIGEGDQQPDPVFGQGWGTFLGTAQVQTVQYKAAVPGPTGCGPYAPVPCKPVVVSNGGTVTFSAGQLKQLDGLMKQALGPAESNGVDHGSSTTKTVTQQPDGRTDCVLFKGKAVTDAQGHVVGTSQRWQCPRLR